MIASKKNVFAGYLFSTLFFCACGQGRSGTENQQGDSTQNRISEAANPSSDSIAIMQAFEQLKTNPAFLKEVGLENERQFSWNDDLYRIIRGDLDGDGTSDALLGFIIEGRGGSNNSDVHYAVFLKMDNQWAYQSQFNANAGSPDFFYGFKEIKNGIIKGAIVDNKELLPDIPVEFIFKDKSVINTYTALHKTENEEREYLKIEHIITPAGQIIPLTGTLEKYEQILGKGSMSTPGEQPDCGTYFGEGTYGELYYAHRIRIELQNEEKAAWRSVFMRGSNYKVNTDKGTITEKTTLDELKNIFYKKESWQIEDGEDGGKVLSIPDGPESDNQLQINFSKDEKLEGIHLFVPC